MEDHRQVKVKDTQANKDRKLTWQYHCQCLKKKTLLAIKKASHTDTSSV